MCMCHGVSFTFLSKTIRFVPQHPLESLGIFLGVRGVTLNFLGPVGRVGVLSVPRVVDPCVSRALLSS